MKLDVLCVGSVEAELIFTAKLLNPSEVLTKLRRVLRSQTKLETKEAIFGTGGDAYLAAVACARLGLHVGIRTQVGADSLGLEAVRRLKEEGVDTSLVMSSIHYATSVMATLRSLRDEHLDIEYTGKAQEYEKKTFLPPANSGLEEEGSLRWLYITGVNGNLAILKHLLDWAKRHDVSVALQPSLKEITLARRALQLFARADVVLMEREDAELLTHQSEVEESLRALRTSGLKTVVIHDGTQAAWAVHNGFLYATQKFGNANYVSASGIDDAYNASFLASHIVDHELSDSLSFGLMAARSVGSYTGSEAGLLRSFAHRAGKVSKKFL